MSEHQFQSMRDAMVSNQLRTTAVSDPRVVAAMKAVPREAFVPEDRKALAYVDVITPLANGRGLNPPMATGRMLTEAPVAAGDSVLIIGAATGYAASVASRLAAKVVAVEEDEMLAEKAASLLKAENNITLVKAPLAAGAPKQGPYDIILIDGLVETIPNALSAQLKDGGRIVAGLLDEGVCRLVRGIKAAGTISYLPFADAESVPLPGFAKPKGFSF